LIKREETILEDLMKPQPRRDSRDQSSKEEDLTESARPVCVDLLQSLKADEGEEDKIDRYMRIVRNGVGRSLTEEEKEVIIKAVRATKETKKGDDRAPPWRKDKERPEKATSPFDEEEKERADDRFKTLKNTLTNRIKKTEESESSSSGEYTYLRGLNITIFLDNKSSEKVISRGASAVGMVKKPHQAKLSFVAQPKLERPKLASRGAGKVRSRVDFDDDDDDGGGDDDGGHDEQVALPGGGVGCKSIPPPGQKKPTSNLSRQKKKPNQKQDVIFTSDMIVEGVTWKDLEQDKKAWEECLRLQQSRSAPEKVTETVWVVNDECELPLIPDSKNHYSASTDWLDKTGPFFSPFVYRRLSAGVSYLKDLMKGGNLRYPDEDFADIKVELVGGGVKLVDELAFDRAALLLRAVWDMGEVINQDGETQLGEDWGMLCNELERAVQERVGIVTCGGAGPIKWR